METLIFRSAFAKRLKDGFHALLQPVNSEEQGN